MNSADVLFNRREHLNISGGQSLEETEQGIEEVEQVLRKLGHNKSDCLIV